MRRFLPRAPEPAPPPDAETEAVLAARLEATARQRLGRSLTLFHLGTGGCGGCELELRVLDSAVHAIARLGLRFVAAPHHADVLVVTGPVTRTLRGALERGYAAMPEGGWVVAVGDCAADGGAFRDSPAVAGGATGIVPVDLIIPGSPPSPTEILTGLRTLLAVHARP